MSLGIFLTLCIVGVDFLIYVLFQWTYGDKRAAMQRKLAAQREAMKQQAAKPFLVSSQRGRPETQARLQKIRARMARGKGGEIRVHGTYSERIA